MIRWNELPFLRITSSFIAGILIHHVIDAEHVAPAVLVISGILGSLIFFLLSGKRFINKNFAALLPLLGYTLLGWLSMHLTIISQKPDLDAYIIAQQGSYIVEIESSPEKTARSVRYFGTVSEISVDGEWRRLGRKVLLYMNDSSSGSCRYGDILLIRGKVNMVENAKNPHAFDYGLYLQRKGIYLQSFVKDYAVIGHISVPSIRSLANSAGDFLDEQLSTYIRSERELNMARAMILGRRNEVSPEMDFAYQATGTSHILAVSGLHVGIIYLVFSSLLAFLKNGRFSWLHYSSILVALWAFAIMTGLSPSAQRAATMLSFVLIARLMNRRSNIYNTLFASAFFILIVSPALIYSVSFQLSFLAVLGIVYLYNSIYGLLTVKNPVINFFWKITVLSLSVQIAAFPVTIYYFNQFPTLFAITNLIAIPTATFVMIGGMVLLTISGLTPLASILGKILTAWIYSFNEILVFFSNMEFTAIEDLQMKLPVVFLLMAFTTFSVRFLETRQLTYFKFFTMILCATLVFWIYDIIRSANQLTFTIYSVRNDISYDIFVGNTCYSYGNISREDEAFNVSPNRAYHRIREIRPLNELANARISKNFDLIVLKGKTFMILKHKQPRIISLPVHIDYLILAHGYLAVPDGLAANFVLVNSFANAQSTSLSEKTPAAIHYIRSDGALKVSL